MRSENRVEQVAGSGAVDRRRPQPVAPHNIHESGLSFQFLVELIARMLHQGGQLRLIDLARQSKLATGIVEPVLGFMRSERLCEIAQRTAAHADISYLLTDLGRSRAEDYSRNSQYAGPAPVSLAAYVEQVECQSALGRPVSRARMHAAFAGCVVGEDLLEQLGVAMNSDRTLFMYGPAGSGKTYAAARLVRVLEGAVYVPYAINVGAELVEVFDPLVHKPVGDPDQPVRRVLDRASQPDERWVLCHRPVVICGGELAPSMLGLEFDEGRRLHVLPAQARANNGVLIIDDLGRQLVHVRDLLNRWVLPLDSRIDYMTLRSGKRFRIPIDVKVIFCTNLAPSAIGDQAFLRRLGYKIHVGEIGPAEYRAIFEQACGELNIPFCEASLDHLLRRHRAGAGQPMLASTPREILEQIRDRARYRDEPPVLSIALLDQAWNNRFAADPAALRSPDPAYIE